MVRPRCSPHQWVWGISWDIQSTWPGPWQDRRQRCRLSRAATQDGVVETCLISLLLEGATV